MSDNSRELRAMRQMAWERAKGELNSMLVTYWGGDDGSFKMMQAEIKGFVESIEDQGLHE